jgi:hypothetical protein
MGYWWCPECKEELSGHHVTYSEHCDYCGTSVLWIEEDLSGLFKKLLDQLTNEHLDRIENMVTDVGIEIRNKDKTELRPISDILNEISEKWKATNVEIPTSKN